MPITYKLTKNGVLLNGGTWIPNDPANHDWQDYQTWRAAGNAPLPADPEPDPAIEAAKARLVDLDRQSVRSIREWLAKRADAPAELKALDQQAATERAKIPI